MSDFELDVTAFQKSLDGYLERSGAAKDALIGIAIHALGEFARLTPVDTGRARAGWYPAMRKLGIPAGSGDEGDIEMQLNPRRRTMYIEISNRVHYTKYLEYGHSSQAPDGMVRRTLAKIQAQLNTIGNGG
jgi:hypothetical protein